jgi:protein-disulfide isomerase
VVERIIETNADVRVIYKEFPILGEESVLASRAALAARPQGRYDQFHAALMQADGPFTEARIMEIATETGLDAGRLAADMADPAIEAILAGNHRLAERLGIGGTPNFVTGDRIIRGALGLEQFQALIAELRLALAEEAE